MNHRNLHHTHGRPWIPGDDDHRTRAVQTESRANMRWDLFRYLSPDDSAIGEVEMQDYDFFDARARFDGEDEWGDDE